MKKAKLFSAVTALALTLSLAPGALAVNTNDTEINQSTSVSERQQLIDSLDLNETIKQSELSLLSNAMLAELNKEDGEIVSIQEVERNLDNGNPYGINLLTMPTSDFKMTVVAQRITEKGSAYDNFKFVATGDWIESPFFEFTDTIALSWSDNFTLYSDYAYINTGGIYDYTRTQRATVDAEKGIAYDVDLRVGKNDGEVVLVAKVYKNNSTGTANVVAEYGHVEIAARDITVGFSGSKDGAEISMSIGFGANLEKASPAYKDFTY